MAGKLNDDHLRNQALKLKDPYDQRDIIYVIPEGAVLLDIVNIYTFDRWPKEKVYCAECGGRHHKKGFTALLGSGQRVLLGSTCGARHRAASEIESARGVFKTRSQYRGRSRSTRQSAQDRSLPIP
jgi:hypothetical protein